MGLRNRLRASSHSGRSPSPQPPPQIKHFAPLPPKLAEPVILNLSQPAPTVTVLSQATDGKLLFQIDYSATLSVTHVPSGQRIGNICFDSDHRLTIHQRATGASTTYRDTLEPPPWFRSLGGNKLYWAVPACNAYQATLLCEVVDGRGWDDEQDCAVAVVLDSRWRKGRVEFRMAMGKDEMDFLLLSAVAEIEDLRGKLREGQTFGGLAAAAGGGAASAAAAHATTAAYLDVATAGANLANAINGGGGGA